MKQAKTNWVLRWDCSLQLPITACDVMKVEIEWQTAIIVAQLWTLLFPIYIVCSHATVCAQPPASSSVVGCWTACYRPPAWSSRLENVPSRLRQMRQVVDWLTVSVLSPLRRVRWVCCPVDCAYDRVSWCARASQSSQSLRIFLTVRGQLLKYIVFACGLSVSSASLSATEAWYLTFSFSPFGLKALRQCESHTPLLAVGLSIETPDVYRGIGHLTLLCFYKLSQWAATHSSLWSVSWPFRQTLALAEQVDLKPAAVLFFRNCVRALYANNLRFKYFLSFSFFVITSCMGLYFTRVIFLRRVKIQ